MLRLVLNFIGLLVVLFFSLFHMSLLHVISMIGASFDALLATYSM